jgi:hypothetical protein
MLLTSYAIITKGFSGTPASFKLIVTQRRLPVKLAAAAPGYPVHKCSNLAESSLTVFEKINLCYGVTSLKTAGNN